MAVSTPITGISMASSTLTPSASSRNGAVILEKPSYFRPTFFGHGVGTLKYTGIQLSRSSRHICNIYGKGSLSAQMNLFEQFARVIKSYANALISTFEDPEKKSYQTFREIDRDLIKMHRDTMEVLASQKQLTNMYEAAQRASEDWYRRAQLALGKGEEDLAREALKRRKSYADTANAVKNQLDHQQCVVDNLVSNTRLLESKRREAMSKKDNQKARAQPAKTRSKLSELLGDEYSSDALGTENTFTTITSIDDFEGKFVLHTSLVADDLALANLKKALSRSTNVKGDFPYSALEDPEIEKELNELRQKA